MSKRFTAISATEFITRLIKKELEIDVCKLNPRSRIRLIKKKKQKKKYSVSQSSIYFAHLASIALGLKNELPVVLKVFKNVQNEKDSQYFEIEGLKYEARVYKQITEEIIDKNKSPNFIPYIGYGCCSKQNTCITITEQAGNGSQFGLHKMYPIYTLKDIFQSVSKNSQEKILFQIIYSLELLSRLKIVHNDLHFYNILVAKFDTEIDMKFIVEGNSYIIKTKYVPYLYDWDMAYSQSLGANPRLLQYKEFNTTNIFDAHRDLYTILCYLNINSQASLDVIKAYSNSSVFKTKENNVPVMKITDKELEEFQEYIPYVIKPDTVYKVNRAIFDSIISDSVKRGLPADSTTIYFNIKTEPDETLTLYFWNPFHCRMTSKSSKFNTPLELLTKYFGKYRENRENRKSGEAKFVYTL